MKKWTFALGVLLLCLVLPAQAAPGTKTQLWEKLLIKNMAPALCGAKSGKMLQMFKITEKQCLATYHFAVKKCLHGIRQIPFYNVEDRYTGQTWGTIVGTCIGLSYDLKYRYKKPNIP